jgi:hypothetical protein
MLEAYGYTMKLPVSYYGSKSYDKWTTGSTSINVDFENFEA